MRLENAYDFPACVGVFGRPQYQLIADGELYHGADRVHYFLAQNHTAFPDFVFEPTRVSPTTDAVLVEGRFTGTHLGSWRGLPVAGRQGHRHEWLIFAVRGDSVAHEKDYFALSTPLPPRCIADDYTALRGKPTAVLSHPAVLVKPLVFSLTHRTKPVPATPAGVRP